MRRQWRSSASVTWDQPSGPDAGRPLQQTSAGPYFSGDATVFPEVLHPIELLGGDGPVSQFHSNQTNTEYSQQFSIANRSSTESKRQADFSLHRTARNSC